MSTFFGWYTASTIQLFQMWLDAWAEARRRPALGPHHRLNVAWQRLIADDRRGIGEGRSCDDPDALRGVLSLLTAGMQLAAPRRDRTSLRWIGRSRPRSESEYPRLAGSTEATTHLHVQTRNMMSSRPS
jgi:hypothetical protein